MYLCFYFFVVASDVYLINKCMWLGMSSLTKSFYIFFIIRSKYDIYENIEDLKLTLYMITMAQLIPENLLFNYYITPLQKKHAIIK